MGFFAKGLQGFVQRFLTIALIRFLKDKDLVQVSPRTPVICARRFAVPHRRVGAGREADVDLWRRA